MKAFAKYYFGNYEWKKMKIDKTYLNEGSTYCIGLVCRQSNLCGMVERLTHKTHTAKPRTEKSDF